MGIRELILEKISSTQSRKLVEVEGFSNIEKNLKKRYLLLHIYKHGIYV